MERALDRLVDDLLRETWDENPVLATSAGIDGYDDRLGDLSADAFARRAEREDGWLTRFAALDDEQLTPDERIDRDLVISSVRGSQIMRDWAGWRRNPAVYLNQGLAGVFELFLHRLRPETELAEAAASRLEQVPRQLEDGRRNLDPALAPEVFVERAMGQCAAGITYARSLVPAEVTDQASRALLEEAGEVAARAYEDFHTFLTGLRDRASGQWAIGEERYTALLREQEMLPFGARELREIGRAAYDEIAADMRARARDLGGTDDWGAVVEKLNEEHPSTPEEMREAYEEWTERARRFLIDRGLVSMPEGERCLVVPSPHFQRPILAVASYKTPPAFKAGLTGHFFVPYPPEGTSDEEIQERLGSNSFNVIPTVAVHEAYPGHHWHLITALQTERPVRKVLGSSYFAEGWALYVELMMREEGLYDDPRHEFFVSESRLFRAARIIVDTTLHLGEMSFEDGVAWVREHTKIPEPTARAEVGRYCTWPTQASSYFTGSVEIERMRARWLADGRGDLRDFHDTIAASGVLPLGLAERAVFG